MSSMPAIGDRMAAYARDAVEHARTDHGITLDYSPGSIKDVETILTRTQAVIDRRSDNGISALDASKSEVDRIAHMYGGYTGEVLRRVADAEWRIETEVVPGEQLICLRRDTILVFPVEKVYKRLAHGPESNVAVYFDVLIDRLWK